MQGQRYFDEQSFYRLFFKVESAKTYLYFNIVGNESKLSILFVKILSSTLILSGRTG